MDKIKVGIIGCGNISEIYLKNLSTKFDIIDLKCCADIVPEKAQEKAQKYNILFMSVEELLNDPEIKIVVNLTIPKAHAQVCIDALSAGKNVYVEKPIAVTREEGKKIVKLAKEKGLLVGDAPDTFLGGGIQTCRKLIDDGWIGKPIAGTAFMMCHGHESWHPDPEFYYQTGGGPMFDMGPYYLTALINLLGPVKFVCGQTKVTFPQRIITSEKKYGKVIDVEVPTHISGIMNFENGAIVNIITSFDVWSHHMPCIEIYGTEGTLVVPDPNTFDGPIQIKRKGQSEWKEVPVVYGYTENSRGIGVADMAYAIKYGREYRANCNVAYHVLDLMHAFHDSSDVGKQIEIQSTCKRPKILPLGLNEGQLDK